MAQEWKVRVVDSGGTAITNAAVSMLRERDVPKTSVVFSEVIEQPLATTHAHSSGGHYRASTSMPADPTGDWRLIVNAGGKSIVIQPFSIGTNPAGGFTTTPRNLEKPASPGFEAQAVDIKTVGVGLTASTTFEVRMFPWSEVILVSGTQYERPSAPLRGFAEGRRDALKAAGRLDDGAVVSIWSLDDRSVFYYFKAKGPPTNWLLGHSVTWPQPPSQPITPGAPWPSKPTDSRQAIHIVELYDYLDLIGKDPLLRGRVKEVSFLSHAFSDGPILYNTNDTTSGASRDPNDFDARVKDFNSSNLNRYRDFGKAMAPGSGWYVWGCHSNGALAVMSEAARVSRAQGKSDTDYFEVKYPSTTPRLEVRLNRLRVLEMHLIWLGAEPSSPNVSYPGKARATLGINVFAPLPGTWSNFDVANRRMVVDRDPGSFNLIKSYHESEPILASRLPLKSGVDGERYVNYADYASIPMPVIPPSSEQYGLVRYESAGKRTTITFQDSKEHDTSGHRTLQHEALNDVGSIVTTLPGRRGHRYILKTTPDSDSEGLLAVVDGNRVRVFLLRRSASGDFDSEDREL